MININVDNKEVTINVTQENEVTPIEPIEQENNLPSNISLESIHNRLDKIESLLIDKPIQELSVTHLGKTMKELREHYDYRTVKNKKNFTEHNGLYYNNQELAQYILNK